MTKIQWTDMSIGAAKMGLYGCEHASTGCRSCWAESMASRFEKEHGYPPGIVADGRWTGKVQVDYSRIAYAFESLPKRKLCRVFAPSSGDLFHPEVPDRFIERCFHEMWKRAHLTFQVLTKRPERARHWWQCRGLTQPAGMPGEPLTWPSNIWIGCSCSTQADLDRMVPHLLQVPAAVRFLSLEPMIGPIDLKPIEILLPDTPVDRHGGWDIGVDWVVIGCESGPKRRPMQLQWARDVVEQCRAAVVPCFVKQVDIDGQVVSDIADPRWPLWAVREFPP